MNVAATQKNWADCHGLGWRGGYPNRRRDARISQQPEHNRGKCDNCITIEEAAMSHSMLRNEQYTVEIVRSGNLLSPWGWEIYRNGKPLPARLLESGFKSEHTAKLAGNVALREFLSGLSREETKPD